MSEAQIERDAIVKWLRQKIEGMKIRNDAAISKMPFAQWEAAEIVYSMGRQSMAMISDSIERGDHCKAEDA